MTQRNRNGALKGFVIGMLLAVMPAHADIATNAATAAGQAVQGSSSALWQIARAKAAQGDSSMLNVLQAQQTANQQAANQNAQTANSARIGDGSIAASLTPAPTVTPYFPPRTSATGGGTGQIVDPFELHQAYVDGLSFPNTNRVVPSEQLGDSPEPSAETAVRAEPPQPAPSPDSAVSSPPTPERNYLAGLPPLQPVAPTVNGWKLPTPSPQSEVATMRLLASVNTSYPAGRAGGRQSSRETYRTTWSSRAMPSAQLVAYMKYHHGLVVGSTEASPQRISAPASGTSSLPEDFVASVSHSRFSGSAHNSALASAQDAPGNEPKWSSAITPEPTKAPGAILPTSYGLPAASPSTATHTGGTSSAIAKGNGF